VKILIVKLSAIGDVIHTLPALNAVRKQYPDAHITWIVEEVAVDLVVGHRALDRVIVSKRKRWLKNLHRTETLPDICKFLRELRDTRYDLILDFQGLLKSGILIALAKGGRKIGFGKGMEHQEHSYLFLNERIPPVDMEIHALERGLMLLKEIGIPAVGKPEYHLPITKEDRHKAGRLLEACGIGVLKRLVAINPVAKWETKLWDNRRFAHLADQLIDRYGVAVAFTGSTEDERVVNEILSFMKKTAANLAGKTSLKTLAAVYKKAACVVSTDTGPMHMAAAVGTPVVALFGPTAPWRTGPFGSSHQIIRAEIKCSPCFKRQCKTIDCMKQISVERVLDVALKVIDLFTPDSARKNILTKTYSIYRK
jgi:3-deoxy-D-manno-octulosonic-acid transferase/heptosyltransferase-1